MNEIVLSRKRAIELAGGDRKDKKNGARNMTNKDLEELLNSTMLTKDSPYKFIVKGD